MSAPDASVPRDLLESAHAVAVIPSLVEGAFVLGGTFGKGLVAARGEEGWSLERLAP